MIKKKHNKKSPELLTVSVDGLNPEPLWDVKQVAVFLGFTEGTVRKMARSGQIPARLINRRWKFRQEEIEAWLQTIPTLR